MSVRRILAVLSTTALMGAAAVAGANGAAADDDDLGDRSLAKVLAKDGSGFDRNPWDYDILDNAVHAVLDAKPDSAVKVLADGDTALTAFLPNDLAFRRLVNDLTGTWRGSEKDVFTAAASVGIDTVEAVLLYHVVPGATIDSRAAKKADGASLDTALDGASFTVDVRDGRIVLVDGDPDDANARVIAPDINKGNKQIGHGISRVLRPMDL
ncbi:MAG TPA: fasciclin domain-containing protein [Pedococcus sp.]|jgi:uncharacterized surface protein with fasciclin (FAS1) repeats|uniref:fasciclin domain-containing protein n=1 Tax=Pedococcus sp. TaxID=2860345 RepID=UPI002F94710A